MKFLVFAAAGAALTLSACNRTDEAPATVEAPPADAAAMDASATPTGAGAQTDEAAAGTTSRGGAGSGAGAGAGAGRASTETMNGSVPMSSGGAMGGPSPAARDVAKEKAEETNLHPKTP